jgi:hypothetical protein
VDLIGPFFGVLGLINLALLIFKVFALVDAATVRADAYPAAGKQTKNVWLVILGAGIALTVLFPGALGLFSIAALIAAIVYIVDVRPAVRAVGRGGRSTGPYGPW